MTNAGYFAELPYTWQSRMVCIKLVASKSTVPTTSSTIWTSIPGIEGSGGVVVLPIYCTSLVLMAIRRLTFARLVCELGLPCMLPFDSDKITPADEAALAGTPDFLAKLRIIFQISRINDISNQPPSPEDSKRHLRMVKLLEQDLQSMAAPLRLSFLQWTRAVKCLHLIVLLNLYSTCLQGPAPTIASPEIQSVAATTAGEIISIFSNAALDQTTTPDLGVEHTACYPKFYRKSVATAVCVLLKISFLKKLPPEQMREVEDSIRKACSTFLRCSAREGDEYHAGARIIEVLSKSGVIESAHAIHPVKTRFGASVYFEIIMAAVQWRKKHGRVKEIGPGGTGGESASIDDPSNQFNGAAGAPEVPTSNAFDSVDGWADLADFTLPDMALTDDIEWLFR
jgi:hypothetical protein